MAWSTAVVRVSAASGICRESKWVSMFSIFKDWILGRNIVRFALILILNTMLYQMVVWITPGVYISLPAFATFEHRYRSWMIKRHLKSTSCYFRKLGKVSVWQFSNNASSRGAVGNIFMSIAENWVPTMQSWLFSFCKPRLSNLKSPLSRVWDKFSARAATSFNWASNSSVLVSWIMLLDALIASHTTQQDDAPNRIGNRDGTKAKWRLVPELTASYGMVRFLCLHSTEIIRLYQRAYHEDDSTHPTPATLNQIVLGRVSDFESMITASLCGIAFSCEIYWLYSERDLGHWSLWLWVVSEAVSTTYGFPWY